MIFHDGEFDPITEDVGEIIWSWKNRPEYFYVEHDCDKYLYIHFEIQDKYWIAVSDFNMPPAEVW